MLTRGSIAPRHVRNALLFVACAFGFARAADTQQFSVAAGGSADLYLEINTSGKVFVQIGAAPPGKPCANFWWIKWPFGNIESLGNHCGFAAFEVPGVSSLALSAKLRVSAPQNAVKLFVAAKEDVARSGTFKF